jgi:hypothetical protein
MRSFPNIGLYPSIIIIKNRQKHKKEKTHMQKGKLREKISSESELTRILKGMHPEKNNSVVPSVNVCKVLSGVA